MTASSIATGSDRATVSAATELRDAEARLFSALGLEVRERWLALERPQMRARVLETGEGPPVLHVHGGGGLGALHAPLAAALPGRRHLMLDRPGFGLSDRVDVAPDFRRRSVELLVSTLDALGLDRVDLVANSIGAGMSLWLALEHPDRVRSLALAGAAAMLPGPEAPFVLRLLATPVIGRLILALERPSPAQVRMVWKRFGHDSERIVPAEMNDVLLAAERVPAYAVAWRELFGATLSFRGELPGLKLTQDELRSLRCPVALAWGSHDPMIDASLGRTAAELIPEARFTLAGSGHLPWLDDAPAVARALEPVLAPVRAAA